MRHTLWIPVVLLLVACGGGSSSDDPGTKPDAVVYVGLGASDAVGVGAVPLSEGYVYELERDLGGLADEVDLHNEGISGAHVDEILDDALADAVAANPDVVTLWTGANDVVGGDSPEDFGDDLDTILSTLASQTNAWVFVADLPDLTKAPLFQVSPDPDVTTARIDAFNQQIAAKVAAHGFVLVRLSDLTITDDFFFIDGFHPNNTGHDQLADAFWTEMEPALDPDCG